MFVLENPSGAESANEKYLRQSRARSFAALNIHKRRRAGYKEPSVNHVAHNTCSYDPNQPTFATRPAPDLSAKRANQRQTHTDSFTLLTNSSNHVSKHSKSPAKTDCKTKLKSKPKSNHSSPSVDRATPTSQHGTRSEVSIHQLTIPPLINTLTNTSLAEKRSLTFFREKTSVEWPGWHDAEFWQVLAPQASYAYPCVKHAIASIGAYHESLVTDVDDEDVFDQHKEFAFDQSRKALTCLSRDYDSMPISAILVAYTAIAAACTYMHDMLYWQAIRMQCNIVDSIRAGQTNLSQSERAYISHHLEPIVERQRSKAGQNIDLLHCLKLTPAYHFSAAEQVTIPPCFTSLHEAESSIESLLNHTTHLTKILQLPLSTIPDVCEELHTGWLCALDQFRSTLAENTPEYVSALILRSCANLGMMMIKTMNASETDEMVFDSFTGYYAELRDANRALLSLFSPTPDRTHVRFGIDVSWITLIGNAASRWCRDPQIRSDLIDMLCMYRRDEAIEAAYIWGEIAFHAKSLEERYLPDPPKSCHDIKLENRVRVSLTSFLWTEEKKTQRIQYQFFPYTDDDYRDFFVLRNTSSESALFDEPSETELVPATDELFEEFEPPQMVMGRGFTSWLKPNSSDAYHTISNPSFFFPISRT